MNLIGDKSFVLVGGVPSSGSTLLSTLLDGHESISCGPETTLFCHPGVWRHNCGTQVLKEHLEGEHTVPEMLNWVKPDSEALSYYASSQKDLLARLGNAPNMHSFIERFYANSARCIVDKTPQNLFGIDAFLSANPNARSVVTVRNGLSCISSLCRRGVHPLMAAVIWVVDVAIAKALNDKYASNGRVMVIRYEDLVTATDATLTRICNFVGVSVAIQQMRNREHSDRRERDATLFPHCANSVSKWQCDPLATVSTDAMHSKQEVLDPIQLLNYRVMRCKDETVTEFVDGATGASCAELHRYFNYRMPKHIGPRRFDSMSIVESERILTAYEVFYLKRIERAYETHWSPRELVGRALDVAQTLTGRRKQNVA